MNLDRYTLEQAITMICETRVAEFDCFAAKDAIKANLEFALTGLPDTETLQAQIEQLTKERDKWKQVALDYDDEICDWKNASGLSGETVDLTHEMLASKLSQLTKQKESAEQTIKKVHAMLLHAAYAPTPSVLTIRAALQELHV